MLTGTLPFKAQNQQELAALKQSGLKVKPSKLRSGLPKAVDELIAAALDAHNRPASALEFGDALAQALTSQSPPPTPPLLDNVGWRLPLRADELRVCFYEWIIKLGNSIPAKIEEGLEQSRVLVLLEWAQAFGSNWAQLESYTFRFRDPLNQERRFVLLPTNQH